MAAWFTAYCTESVGRITADDLRSYLDGLDLYTWAELYDIENEEEVVDHALAHLRIEPVSKRAGVWFSLRYKPGNVRPINIHRWHAKKRVRVEIAEALEQFEEVKGRNVTRVRNHLAKCAEVVALELGWVQTEGIGLMFAAKLAEFFVVEGEGLIRDQNDDWWAMPKNGGPAVLLVRGSNQS